MESKILYDADKMDSLGAIGVKRWVLHMQNHEISPKEAVNSVVERFDRMHFSSLDNSVLESQDYLLRFLARLDLETR